MTTTATPWLRKPLSVLFRQEQPQQSQESSNNASNEHQVVEPHLTLFDLVSIGVGGTVGSGIFVLAGFIAHNYAGPSTVLSFALGGLAATCSGIAYAELAGRLPASGSTYQYTYVAMGEFAAIIAFYLLTLEYAISGAAVARSWGDKVVSWIHPLNDSSSTTSNSTTLYHSLLNDINPMAGLVSAAATFMLWNGVRESKTVANIFTILKLLLVLFMIVGGFYYTQSSHFRPFAPNGPSGVLRGAISSFFSFLGYDEVCVMGGEALHPQHDMPRAVLWTLAIVTLLYMAATIALVGMQSYTDIDGTSAFPKAFQSNGAIVAAQIAAAGEVITLPVVVLLSLLAQPRLQLAVVRDGLLPRVLGRVDSTGNLRSGVLIAGIAMTLVATFVPFGHLDDLISSGILLAFSMTNSSLILLRCESSPLNKSLLPRLLILYNTLCLVTSLVISKQTSLIPSITLLLLTLTCGIYMARSCPRTSHFGGSLFCMDDGGQSFFETPMVPLIPCLGIFVNWYLISQLEWRGLGMLLLYLGLASILYFCRKHPVVEWKRSRRQNHEEHAVDARENAVLLRSISLPERRNEHHGGGETQQK